MTSIDQPDVSPFSPEHLDLTGPEVALQPEASPVSRFSGMARKLLRGGEQAIIAIEVLPFTNGPLRYGAFATTLAATKDTALSTAVLAGSTAALEGGAGLAFANVLERGESRTVDKATAIVDKIVPKGKLPLSARAVLAVYTGTVLTMLEKFRNDKDSTIQEKRKFALQTTGWLTGVLAVQGVCLSEGLTDPTDVKTTVPAAAVLGGMAFVYRRVLRQIKQQKQEEELS